MVVGLGCVFNATFLVFLMLHYITHDRKLYGLSFQCFSLSKSLQYDYFFSFFKEGKYYY